MTIVWVVLAVYLVMIVVLASFLYYQGENPFDATICGVGWPIIVFMTLVVLPGRIAVRFRERRKMNR